MLIRYFGGLILSPFTSTQNFFAGRSEDFRREEELTRSEPFAVLALLMLSMAATALAQVEGGENGTDQLMPKKIDRFAQNLTVFICLLCTM